MSQPVVLPYTIRGASAFIRPWLPIRLLGPSGSIDEFGLIDSGGDISVLPFALGHRLGLKWSSAVPLPSVGGALHSTLARRAFVDAVVGQWAPVTLAFSWLQRDDIPLILGQLNFFREFDVCFFGSKAEFQVQPRIP